jgi:caa(3)-type oxidase subunit IV
MSEGTLQRVEGDVAVAARGELGHALEPAPGMLPGEIKKHPSPFKYVMIAVVLCVITAIEVATSYLEGDIPDGLIVFLLLAMALLKFVGVAGWYMHLQTDQPIFRRFFILGCVAAVILYTIVLATLSVFAA